MAVTREKKVPALVDKPMDFCPGCGHGIISRLIMEALEELDQMDNIIFPIGVGCSSNLGAGLECDRLHCCHGRAGAVATGMKRVNPDVLVVSYQGDGDAYNIGIGYLGTNTPIDRCYDCGFQGDFEPTEEGFKCPECGNSDPDHCNVTKRTCGYLGNPVQRPMVHGRHEEIAHRVKHMSGETGHVTLGDGSEREWFEEAK